MEPNTSNETNNNDCTKEQRRQQFSNKQRMDMYAFCVLELEMHSNKVSIKKQQQAIQRVLNEQQRLSLMKAEANESQSTQQSQQQQQQQPDQRGQQQQHQQPNNANNSLQQQLPAGLTAQQNENPPPLTPTMQQQPPTTSASDNNSVHGTQQQNDEDDSSNIPMQQNGDTSRQESINGNLSEFEGKTLLELQQEVAMTQKSYSDYQKTQVLTSSMLRDVQARFAKYYPDSAIPSRTTIKHVFEKCVAHGTVENIKTPRKATKIPQGDEIEYLLIHEPQLSLRQMAQKLNVSTGTVSRRCKALGLIPESVTIKHQQLATARRQKQIKKLESQNKSKNGRSS